MNPPICKGCGKPIGNIAANEPTHTFWHGSCWARDHARSTPPGPIGQSSHDERVTDGLELP